MGQVIQVVVTKTYRYVPDLEGFDYRENGIKSIEDALPFDRDDYESGNSGLEEIAGSPEQTVAVWSIIE
jgi:hypothetical protein